MHDGLIFIFSGTEVLRKSFSTPSLNSILGFIDNSSQAVNNIQQPPQQLPTCLETDSD